MKKHLPLLFLLLFPAVVFSGSPDWEWAKSMGGINDDQALSLATDASGNVYTTGIFYGTVDFDPGPGIFNLTSAGYYDIFISKLDASGNFVWAKAMGGIGEDAPNAIAVDGSGNVYTAGSFVGTADFDPGVGIFDLTSTGGYTIFISKLDSSGNFVWAKAMDGTNGWATCVALDASGNVYTTGTFQGTVDFDPGAATFNLTSAGISDIFVSKLDSLGNFIWTKQIGGIDDERVTSTSIDPFGNVCISGYFYGTVDFDPGVGIFNLISAGGEDIFISELHSTGNFIWAKRIGGIFNDGGAVLSIDTSGNVYTTGVFNGVIDFDPGTGIYNLTSAGGSDIFISKLDASGNFVWAKRIGGISNDYMGSLVVDRSSNVYLTGEFSGTCDFDPDTGTFNLTANGTLAIFICKLNGSGNFDWAKSINCTGDVYVRSIAVNASDNIFISGSFHCTAIVFGADSLLNADNTGSTEDIFIAKLDTFS
jgi:hypothetical protein